MSETKKFSDCPVASDEGMLLCVDGAGNVRRVSRDTVVNQSKSAGFNSPQWVRLFQFTSTNVIFQLAKNYYSQGGGSIAILASLHPTLEYNGLVVLGRALNRNLVNPFGKMRLVGNGSTGYLDFYYQYTDYNDLYLTVFPTYRNVTLLMEGNATVPNGFTVKEVDISGG